MCFPHCGQETDVSFLRVVFFRRSGMTEMTLGLGFVLSLVSLAASCSGFSVFCICAHATSASVIRLFQGPLPFLLLWT